MQFKYKTLLKSAINVNRITFSVKHRLSTVIVVYLNMLCAWYELFDFSSCWMACEWRACSFYKLLDYTTANNSCSTRCNIENKKSNYDRALFLNINNKINTSKSGFFASFSIVYNFIFKSSILFWLRLFFGYHNDECSSVRMIKKAKLLLCMRMGISAHFST